jgi:chromate transporter
MAGHTLSGGDSEPARAGGLAEVFLTALRLGLTSFGGPIAHLGYFREEYVVRRRWLPEQTYGELVGLCQFLPGPTSSQVGFAVGWLRAGPLGGLLAWLGFTLPSALLMLALAFSTPAVQGPAGQAVVHGLKLAALAVVAQAVVSMARTLTPDLPRIAVAVAAAAAVLLAANPAVQILVIAAGALIGLFLRPAVDPVQGQPVGFAPSPWLGWAVLGTFAVLLAASVLPVPGLDLAAAFYRAGALVFGGGHVVLPLLREGLSAQAIGDDVFLAGYGAAQALPGPLFAIASYLGAVASPGAPAMGALAATLAIFLPGLLLVTAALAFRAPILGSRWAARAIAGINAAVVGILAAAFYDPLWTSTVAGVSDLVIAAAGFVLLARFRMSPLLVVALSVAAAVVIRL